MNDFYPSPPPENAPSCGEYCVGFWKVTVADNALIYGDLLKMLIEGEREALAEDVEEGLDKYVPSLCVAPCEAERVFTRLQRLTGCMPMMMPEIDVLELD